MGTRARVAAVLPGAEQPLDLTAQIAEQLQAIQVVIGALNPASGNPQELSLLSNAQMTQSHLQLLQAHMAAANKVVQVSSTDPDFVTLSGIATRLDVAIRNAAAVTATLGQMQVVLSSVNQGFLIAHRLASQAGVPG